MSLLMALRRSVFCVLTFALSAYLVSCGSGPGIIGYGNTKVALYETSDYVGMPALPVGAHRFATGTVSHDSVRFWCFNDSDMSRAWYSAVPLGTDQLWFPRLYNDNGSIIAVGPLTSIQNGWSYGDVYGLKAVTLDPSTGTVRENARPIENPVPEESMERGAFNIAYSPDSSKILFFQYKLSDALDKDSNRSILMTGSVYSRTLKPLGFGTLRLPIDPEVTDKNLKRDVYAEDVYIDNDGNFYQVGSAKPNTLLVFCHNLKTHESSELDTTIDGIDTRENDYGFGQIKAGFEQPGRMTLAFARLASRREVDAIVLGTYDFNTMKIEHLVSHTIKPEQLDQWFGDDRFLLYRVSGVRYTASPRMLLVVVEKQEGAIDIPHIRGWSHGNAIILGFDTTSHLVFQSALLKSSGFVDVAQDFGFMTREVPGRLEMYYEDIHNSNLYRVDLSLPSGFLGTPELLANFDGPLAMQEQLSGFVDDKTGYIVCKDGRMMPTITVVSLKQ